ncbi:tRNA (adenosine(37)-N6)-threonylcarbamoyltransferase complex ATPase subunit type 1 TsaE [Anaeromassilibacillus sp. SJQ-5]
MDREAEALRGRTWVTRSAAETEALGAAVGRALTGGAVLALFGGLGMGKTAFVRGLAAGRGLEAEVSSPTFALVHEYGGQPPLVHFDMYRVTGWDDLYSTGFFDYIDAGCILAVEWSENVEGALPEEALRFRLARREDGAREIACE